MLVVLILAALWFAVGMVVACILAGVLMWYFAKGTYWYGRVSLDGRQPVSVSRRR